jgi:hypothetical protein
MHRDSLQPTPERGGILQAVEIAQRFHECILHDVLCLGTSREQACDDTRHLTNVAMVQRFLRPSITAPRSLYELGVRFSRIDPQRPPDRSDRWRTPGRG